MKMNNKDEIRYDEYFLMIYQILYILRYRLYHESDFPDDWGNYPVLTFENEYSMLKVTEELYRLGYIKDFLNYLNSEKRRDDSEERVRRQIRTCLIRNRRLEITLSGMEYFLNDPIMKKIEEDIKCGKIVNWKIKE